MVGIEGGAENQMVWLAAFEYFVTETPLALSEARAVLEQHDRVTFARLLDGLMTSFARIGANSQAAYCRDVLSLSLNGPAEAQQGLLQGCLDELERQFEQLAAAANFRFVAADQA